MAGYLKTLVAALAGVELPVPVVNFLKGKPVPFALNTRETLPAWCSSHGYVVEQRKTLGKLIRVIVTRDAYLRAVVDGVHRTDLDGLDTGPPSDSDREHARERLAAPAAVKPKAGLAPGTPESVPPQPVIQPEAIVASPPPPPPARPALLSMPRSARPAAMPRREPVVALLNMPSRTPRPSAVRPIGSSLALLPEFAVREAVERINNRRNSTRLIIAYNKAGNHAAAEAERANWAADAVGVWPATAMRATSPWSRWRRWSTTC